MSASSIAGSSVLSRDERRAEGAGEARVGADDDDDLVATAETDQKRRRVLTPANASRRDPVHPAPGAARVETLVEPTAGAATAVSRTMGAETSTSVRAPHPELPVSAAASSVAPLRTVLEQLRSLDPRTNGTTRIATFASFQPPACWSLPSGFEECSGPVFLHLTRFRLHLLRRMLTQRYLRVYLGGPHGSGKSGTMLLLAAAAKELGWTTLYFPAFPSPAGRAAKGERAADDEAGVLLSMLLRIKEQLFDAPGEEGKAASPSAQRWAMATGVMAWMTGREATLPSVPIAQNALCLLWVALSAGATVPIFVGIDEHSELVECAAEFEATRNPTLSTIRALLTPWKGALTHGAFRVALTGSTHSRFFDSLPEVETDRMAHVPMLTEEEVLQLLTHESAPLRAGAGLLGRPCLVREAARVLHRLSGGLYRHVSKLGHGICRRAVHPSPEVLQDEKKYLTQLEDTLLSQLSVAWRALVSRQVRRPLDEQSRDACARVLQQVLATAADDIGQLAPRQAARVLLDWGVLALSEETGGWRFVSMLARDAVLREWIGLRPLSPIRAEFAQELMSLFLARYCGQPARLELAGHDEAKQDTVSTVFVESAQIDLRSMVLHETQVTGRQSLLGPMNCDALEAMSALDVQPGYIARVLNLRTGASSPGFDGLVFLPTPATLLCIHVAPARDLSNVLSEFRAGCDVLLTTYRLVWRAIAKTETPVKGFAVAETGTQRGVPLGFVASATDGAWRSTLRVRVLLLLGLSCSKVSNAWQTEVSGRFHAQETFIPVEVADRDHLEAAIGVAFPRSFMR